nr:unnamed protein product [Callosobruchus chinensis]
MRSVKSFFSLAVLVSIVDVKCQSSDNRTESDKTVVDEVLENCDGFSLSVSCISTQVSKKIERALNKNISTSLIDGLRFVRNDEKVDLKQARALDGFERLTNAISNFISTHTVTLDFAEDTLLTGRSEDVGTGRGAGRRGGGGGGGGGGHGGGQGGDVSFFNHKEVKKEKKYYQYAFLVLLGIFGLTGPIVMKVIGVMAAKALMAAKAALIIVGGVALKKIFEHRHEKPQVRVTTVPLHHESEEDHYHDFEYDHEHDRFGYASNHIPHGDGFAAKMETNNPYSAYYAVNSVDNDFAPIYYGTPYKPKTPPKAR